MADSRSRPWTFLTAHGMVVLYLARNPKSTVLRISDELDITERQVARILKQLAADRVLTVTRAKGRNSYAVNAEAPLRRARLGSASVGQFVRALAPLMEASS